MHASAEIRLESALLQAGPETAHILFMDMVGYSRLYSNDQRTAQDELVRTVRATEDFREARVNGQMICRPTGDGMALLFFGGSLSAIRCAVQITEALRDHPLIRLRMGISTGQVLRVQDINSNSDIAGEGIVVAKRVMDLGDAGHILISGSYKLELDRTHDIRPPLGNLFVADLGNCTVKHGLTVRVFNLRDRKFGTLKFGNANVPKKIRQQMVGEPVLLTAPPPPPVLSFMQKAAKITIAGILFVVFLFFVALAYKECISLGIIHGPPAMASSPSPNGTAGTSPAGDPTKSGPAKVTVPYFVGMTWAYAKKLADKSHLKLLPNNIPIRDVDSNDVLYDHQYPAAGLEAYSGDKIYVLVQHHARKTRSSSQGSGPRIRVKENDTDSAGTDDTSPQDTGETTPSYQGDDPPQTPSNTAPVSETQPKADSAKGNNTPSQPSSVQDTAGHTSQDAPGSDAKTSAPDAKPAPSQTPLAAGGGG